MHEVDIDERVQLLRDVWLFASCSDAELDAIARLTRAHEVEPPAVLSTEGAPGHEFVVVVEGTASVLSRGAEVGEIGPGMCFGELALLDGGPRTATVRALTPMQLLVLDRSEFDQLVEAAGEQPLGTVAREVLARWLKGRRKR